MCRYTTHKYIYTRVMFDVRKKTESEIIRNINIILAIVRITYGNEIDTLPRSDNADINDKKTS